jgi:hypothetical protein
MCGTVGLRFGLPNERSQLKSKISAISEVLNLALRNLSNFHLKINLLSIYL